MSRNGPGCSASSRLSSNQEYEGGLRVIVGVSPLHVCALDHLVHDTFFNRVLLLRGQFLVLFDFDAGRLPSRPMP